jgi:lipoprotein-releasing system ATP-binding protein
MAEAAAAGFTGLGPPAPLPPGPVLRLEGVTKDYGEGDVVTRVLHGVDLEVAPGEFTALIGPSGSGKSTLLNLVGLLDRPTGGVVTVAGQDVAALDDDGLTRHRGRTIGFVFQFHHLLPEFSALENVMLPMMAARGRPEPSMVECGTWLLRQVGLEAVVDRRASRLSGGQAQRVAIARALGMSPRIVLADEPTGNLDTHSADEIFALLRDFNRRAGITFVVVTHDPRLAARCDRIVELVDGRIVSDRPNAAVTEGAR